MTLLWHKGITLQNCESGSSPFWGAALQSRRRGGSGERFYEAGGVALAGFSFAGGRRDLGQAGKGRGSAELAGGTKPQVRRKKSGWTAARRNAFLAELAATCNVAASLRKVKMGETGVYKLRRQSAEFRAAWAEALREGYAKLELMLLERAMNGTVKTVTRPGGAVDKTHEYPNALALALLRMHKDGVAAAEADHDATDIEAVRERIGRKLAAVRKRLEASGGGE